MQSGSADVDVGVGGVIMPTNNSFADCSRTDNNSECDSNLAVTAQCTEVERAITLSVMCGLSALTNLSAFYMLTCGYRRNQRRLSIFWAPLINLCVADFIITTFGMGGSAAWHFTDQWLAGDFMCRFVKYVQVLGNNASTYIIMFISVDRAVAVTRPMTSLSTAHCRIRYFLISAWLLAAIGSMPQWFIFSVVEAPAPYEPGFYQCYSLPLAESTEMSLLYSLLVCVFSFLIPFIVMIVAYTMILVVIRRKSREHPNDRAAEDHSEKERLSCRCTGRQSEASSPASAAKHDGQCQWPRLSDADRLPLSVPTPTSITAESPAFCRQVLSTVNGNLRHTTTIRTTESSLVTEAEVGKNHVRPSQDNRNVWFKRARQKSLKTFLVIITSFLICWIPYYSFFLAFTIRNYVRYLSVRSSRSADDAPMDVDGQLEETVASWTNLFAMLNPLVNPLIYGSFQCESLKRIRNSFISHATRTRTSRAPTELVDACRRNSFDA